MASLLGVHYLLKRKPQINRAQILKIQEKFRSLSDQGKMRMKYLESGIIELANGDLCVVDGKAKHNEMNLEGGNGLVWRKIEFAIEDPLLLERLTMFQEARKTLNNAEKRCLADRHAAVIYADGEYYLIMDPKMYADYVLRYGTECKSCGESEAKQIKNVFEGRIEK